MNLPDETPLDRRSEILIDLALQGLTPEERGELDELLEAPEDEALKFERIVARLGLELEPPHDEPLPASLRSRVEQDADRFFASRSPTMVDRSVSSRMVPWLGWVVAAGLILAFGPGLIPKPDKASSNPPSPNLKPSSLAATEHPLARGAGGTLVWDGVRQQGSLSIRGLAEVEPDHGVYQLWIFDATRDERFPVDGGTFLVNDSNRTTTIAIHPSLKVRRPSLFAITLEPPGGVVVSDRKRIVLTASP